MLAPRSRALSVLALSLLAHAAALLALRAGIMPHQQPMKTEPAPVQIALLPPPAPPTPPAITAPPAAPAEAPKPAAPKPLPVERKPPKPKTHAPAPQPTPAPAAKAEPTPAPAAPAEPAAPAPPAPAVSAPPAPPVPPAAPVHVGVSIPASYAASNRPPVQPPRSVRNGEEGTVMLRVQVQADGSAGQIEIAKSSGFPMLDDAAKSAVQNWRFHPATSDGKPVTEWFRVPITFKLSN
jgi:protein TonB